MSTEDDERLRQLSERLGKVEHSQLKAFEHIESLVARMVNVEQMLAMPAFQAGVVDGLKERVDTLTHRYELQQQFLNGMAQRIDRTQGTLTDLLQRFEAWKTIGNDLVELAKTQGERIDLHGRMITTATEAIKEIFNTLKELRAIFTNEGDDDDRSTEGARPALEGSGGEVAPGDGEQPRAIEGDPSHADSPERRH